MESRSSRIKMSEIRHQNLKSRYITENSGDDGLPSNGFSKGISVQAHKKLGELIKQNQTL